MDVCLAFFILGILCYDILCLRFGAWKRWLTFHVEMGILIPEFHVEMGILIPEFND